jgi:hypothetical protein
MGSMLQFTAEALVGERERESWHGVDEIEIQPDKWRPLEPALCPPLLCLDGLQEMLQAPPSLGQGDGWLS